MLPDLFNYRFIRRILYIGFWPLFFLPAACGGAAGESSENSAAEEAPAPASVVNEDELILRLSLDLTANPQTQAEKEQNAIINYAIDELLEIQRTPSGLYYQILEAGQGDSLQWADRVRAHYRGYFLDGREFDSSYRRDRPIEFYIGNVIPGWNEGLQLLREGDKARLLVPSRLGYGTDGMKDGETYLVPPNSVLVFELEVLKKLS